MTNNVLLKARVISSCWFHQWFDLMILRVMPFINSNYVFVFNVYPAIHYVYQSTNWGAWGYVSVLTFSLIIVMNQLKYM